MVAFDSICRIYYLPDLLWIFEGHSQFSPVFIPGFKDIRVLLIPFLAKFFLGEFSVIEIHGAVNFLQVSADCLAVFVRYELAAVANLVDYAELIFRLRKNRIYRITKPRKVIVAGYENDIVNIPLHIYLKNFGDFFQYTRRAYAICDRAA